MNSKPISKFENKVWLILIVVLAVVLLSAFFVFKSLTGIVHDITEEARPDETVILMKEVMTDLTEAENCVKSYSLTNEAPYLEEYNNHFNEVGEKITRLRTITKDDQELAEQMDTLDTLIQQKFLILENMLLLRSQSRVGSALDRIATEIEESVDTETSSTPEDAPTASNQTSTGTASQDQEEQEKFFKRLLNKRKKNEESNTSTETTTAVENTGSETSVDTESGSEISLEEINREILAIKREEAQIDESVRDKELFLIQEDKKVMDHIRGIFVDLEAKETLSMEEKLTMADERSGRTNLLIGLFCILACVLLMMAGYAVNTYVKRNEAYKIALRKAKLETDQKNQEITDSITYAQKIQEAILPDKKLFNTYLKESFILYKPKDIVAGDFYWTVKTNDKLFVAVADCTGHGVPGAMVSVVCSTALNRCVREFGLKQPAEILEKCRELVIETFASGDYSVNDGMDICLIALREIKEDNKDLVELEYSGANNSLYLVRNGLLQTLPADKQPIGKYQYQTAFTNHRLIIEKGTMVYLFSDGYADQFGGQYGKKFKYKPFQDLLVANADREIKKQLVNLNHTFENWRGSLEQIDDVCVIGLRL